MIELQKLGRLKTKYATSIFCFSSLLFGTGNSFAVQEIPRGVNPPATIQVTVWFNEALDPALENGAFGAANARWNAFQSAVATWNNALTNIGPNWPGVANTPVQFTAKRVLQPAGANDWGVDQGNFACNDAVTGFLVYKDIDLHLGDAQESTSTGHHVVHGTDNVLRTAGPGWIYSTEPNVHYSPGQSDMEVLARTYLKYNAANTRLIEADIGWMTHVASGNQCDRIPWDFRGVGVIPVPVGGPPNANRFDYYSVMLHELGHALGLDHFNDPVNNKNVMRPAIGQGQVAEISNTEIDHIKAIYYQQQILLVKQQIPLPIWALSVLGIALASTVFFGRVKADRDV